MFRMRPAKYPYPSYSLSSLMYRVCIAMVLSSVPSIRMRYYLHKIVLRSLLLRSLLFVTVRTHLGLLDIYRRRIAMHINAHTRQSQQHAYLSVRTS